MQLNVDEMDTLPELASLPPKVQKLIKKVARRLVLLEDAEARGACLANLMAKVRDRSLLPQANPCDPSAQRAEVNTRAWFMASLALREAGEIDIKLTKAGAA